MLGSGLTKIAKYVPLYNNSDLQPSFEDGDIFKAIIPISLEADLPAPAGSQSGGVNLEIGGHQLATL